MAANLNPCISLPIHLCENDFQDLVQKVKDWTIMHGCYNFYKFLQTCY